MATAALGVGIDARAFVAGLYRNVLGREPDPEGWRHYVRELERGLPPAELVSVFLGSDEYRERRRHQALVDIAAARRASGEGAAAEPAAIRSELFPEDYAPPGEAGRSYLHRLRSGFLDRYCSGPLVLDIGYTGYDNPEKRTAIPHAIGVDLDYPGYDGRTLPFADGSVDTVFSSHCLEHILFDHQAIRDWYRTLRVGGFIVCIVPAQALYEKRRFLPSAFNEDHKRMYTPASLARSFEEALEVNSFRVRHLAENDRGFNYALGPGVHSDGAYEIEMVVEKIVKPDWELA